MNREQQIRQQVSELADGELETQHIRGLLATMQESASSTLKDDWDLYHRIGDCLRNEPVTGDLSAQFSCRLRERLDAEPVVLAPRRRDFPHRLRGWGLALTAVAAAAVGFAWSPSLFDSPTAPPTPSLPSLASGDNAGAPGVAPVLLADAGSPAAHAPEVDYLLLHLSANPSLYGAPVLARRAAFSSGSKD